MSPRKSWQVPHVRAGNEVLSELLRGSRQITAAIAPTFGPLPRRVLHQRPLAGRSLEFLDSGGTVARRIVQVVPRTQDVGAMMLRHTLWRLHETVGDGTVTAALIFQALTEAGGRYLAAGGNAMTLRPHLEAALRLAQQTLQGLARPRRPPAALVRLAHTLCPDEALADLLAEALDISGPLGSLTLHPSPGREVFCEYREARLWEDSALLSTAMLNDIPNQRACAENAVLLISDLELDTPQDVIAIFQAARGAEADRLILVARKVSETILGVLAHPQNRARLAVIAAQTPGTTPEAQFENISDLALLCGAKPLLSAAGDQWQQATSAHLGHARQAWAGKHSLGIIGGQADPLALRQQIHHLQMRYRRAEKTSDRAALQQRLGRLQGGSVTLHLGGATETEVETRQQLAERTLLALRSALLDGVVPGGGSALLACAHHLQQAARRCENAEAATAYRLTAQALQQPLAALAANAGLQHRPALAAVRQSAGTETLLSLDVVSGQAVEPFEAGLLDSAGVLAAALHSAIASAALTLTTNVVIHRRNPPEAYET